MQPSAVACKGASPVGAVGSKAVSAVGSKAGVHVAPVEPSAVGSKAGSSMQMPSADGSKAGSALNSVLQSLGYAVNHDPTATSNVAAQELGIDKPPNQSFHQ